jgi:CBS domain containing-hemolysin-like protein
MTALELALCIGLIFISAFISASEVAVFSLSRFQIRSIRERSKNAWRTLRRLINDPAGLLTTLLVTNEIVNIALTTIIAGLIDQWWRSEGGIGSTIESAARLSPRMLLVLQVLFGALITTPIVLLLCEVTPKTVAERTNVILAPLVSQPLLRLYKSLLPVRFLLIELLRLVRSLFLSEEEKAESRTTSPGSSTEPTRQEGTTATAAAATAAQFDDEPPAELHRDSIDEAAEASGTAEPRNVLNEEDFLSIVEQGKVEGAIEEDEFELIRKVFELDDRKVRDILIPVSQVRMIPSDTRVGEALDRMRGPGRFTRIPVHSSTSRRTVVGILYSKDLLLARLDPRLSGETVEKITRKPFVVSPELQLNTLFRRLKASRTHMAIVESPPGTTVGIVTMSDVLEALFEDYVENEDEHAQAPAPREAKA